MKLNKNPFIILFLFVLVVIGIYYSISNNLNIPIAEAFVLDPFFILIAIIFILIVVMLIFRQNYKFK